MILYYAPGGGLGHLTRGRRVLETLGLTGEGAFITSSRHANDDRVTGGIPAINIPAHLERDVDAHRAWLREAVTNARGLIADTFPAGIQGELSGLDVPMDLVARSLRWQAYRSAVPSPLPRFDTVWSIESLEPEHETALRAQASHWRRLDLALPAAPSCDAGDYWLIVHSGPEAEVLELVAYAQELQRLAATPSRVLVATQCAMTLPPGFERVDAYPVAHLLAGATRIISAAGYNVMLETSAWASKHDPIPFARRYDDQYARARRRRTG